MKVGKTFRKLKRWWKRLFEPWQDIDPVRAEVQASQRNAPRLAWRPPDNPKLKRIEETQVEWIKRRDSK